MPTKDELEKENAALKAELKALQPGGLVCTLTGAALDEARYYVRHPDYAGGPPVAVCYEVFEQASQDGRWCMDTNEEAP